MREATMASQKQSSSSTTVMCAVIAMDHTNLCYNACSFCERTLPDTTTTKIHHQCKFCHNSSPTKRFFRLLVSIATDVEVKNVMCFDRAAKVLFGCSADEFTEFVKIHPFADAGKALEGEMFRMTLSKPKNGNAQHLRVASIVPLRTGFQPAIETLREMYKLRASS